MGFLQDGYGSGLYLEAQMEDKKVIIWTKWK